MSEIAVFARRFVVFMILCSRRVSGFYWSLRALANCAHIDPSLLMYLADSHRAHVGPVNMVLILVFLKAFVEFRVTFFDKKRACNEAIGTKWEKFSWNIQSWWKHPVRFEQMFKIHVLLQIFNCIDGKPKFMWSSKWCCGCVVHKRF